VELVFYGGVEGKIGGNIVALSANLDEDKYTFLFDMGLNPEEYYQRTRYKVELRTLKQLQRWKLVPKFENFGEVRACFISHAHSDHCKALTAFLDSGLRGPKFVWSSHTTKKIIGNNTIRSFDLTVKPFEEGIFYEDVTLKNKKLNLKVAPFPTDHSILGSCAWIVEIKNWIIVYTGDFRDHGHLSAYLKEKNQFWTYVKKRSVSKKKKVIVITEGTNFGIPGRFCTETQLKRRFGDLLNNFRSELVTIVVSEKDLWRVLTVNEVISASNRKQKRYIFYDSTVAKLCRKAYETFQKDYEALVPSLDFLKLRNTLFVKKEQEISDDVLLRAASNPSKFVFVVTVSKAFPTLDQIARRNAGGCCILSLSEGMGEMTGIPVKDYAKEIAELGFSVEELHSSGHIYPNRLIRILEKINPEKIFIIHSLAPEGFCKFVESRVGINCYAPLIGENFEII
jgi:mRNA degradation ribonuclease J1/J2